MTDLVSICIPAYNNEKDIKGTLESLLEQTYKKYRDCCGGRCIHG